MPAVLMYILILQRRHTAIQLFHILQTLKAAMLLRIIHFHNIQPQYPSNTGTKYTIFQHDYVNKVAIFLSLTKICCKCTTTNVITSFLTLHFFQPLFVK